MKTDEAGKLYKRRQQLIEPVFGIIKEQLGARRFLLRGLTNVQAEFSLIATTFNLKMLSRVWIRLKQAAKSVPKWQCRLKTQKIFELDVIPMGIR